MIAALHRAAALLALAVLPAACANFSALSPGDSAQDVEARVGAPGTVWKNADGSEVWEYPLGPTGVQTFMIDIGTDRAVQAVHQVLREETFSKVVAGMSRDEVRRLLGKPRDIGFSALSDEEIWSWRYREWGVRNMELYVQFDRSTGVLKKVTRFQVDTSDGKRH